jgi:hypothetical protein
MVWIFVTVELTGFHEIRRSENPSKRVDVGRLLWIEAASITQPSFDITLPQSEPQYPLPQFLL